MAKSGCARKAGSTLIKSLFLILPLLCLFCNGDLQLMKKGLTTVMESLQILLEETIRSQTAEQNRTEVISKVLERAKSLTNMEELEIFLEDLQEAADEAYENKIFEKYRLALDMELYDVKMSELHHLLQEMKIAQNVDPSAKQVVRYIESGIKKLNSYIDLKNKVFAGGAKDTTKKLTYVVNVLKSQMLHDEL